MDTYPEGETEESIAKRKRILIQKYSTIINKNSEIQPNEHKEILDNLSKTFKAQRDFLNDIANPPDINTLLSNWPMLSLKTFLFHHYSFQMGHSIEQLRNGLTNDKIAIFAYGKAHNLTEAETADDSYAIMKIIFNHFKEDVENLITLCPVSINFSILLIISKN